MLASKWWLMSISRHWGICIRKDSYDEGVVGVKLSRAWRPYSWVTDVYEYRPRPATVRRHRQRASFDSQPNRNRPPNTRHLSRGIVWTSVESVRLRLYRHLSTCTKDDEYRWLFLTCVWMTHQSIINVLYRSVQVHYIRVVRHITRWSNHLMIFIWV